MNCHQIVKCSHEIRMVLDYSLTPGGSSVILSGNSFKGTRSVRFKSSGSLLPLYEVEREDERVSTERLDYLLSSFVGDPNWSNFKGVRSVRPLVGFCFYDVDLAIR
jgi:hypothetical protein